MASAIQVRLLQQDDSPTQLENKKSDSTDRIGYDAWLLPPITLSAADRLIEAVSIAAGPLALCAFAAMAVRLFI
jgi:hypothetical protein